MVFKLVVPGAKQVLVLLSLISFSAAVAASNGEERWVLKPEQSSLSFLSTKKLHITELHSFTAIKGKLDKREARIVIDAGSVKTGVDIRDTRIMRHLLKVKNHPFITVSAAIDPASFSKKINRLSQSLSVELLGKSYPIDAELLVVNDGEHLLVVSQQPIILAADKMGLSQGLIKLSDLVGGLSISQSIPVWFSLLFVKE